VGLDRAFNNAKGSSGLCQGPSRHELVCEARFRRGEFERSCDRVECGFFIESDVRHLATYHPKTLKAYGKRRCAHAPRLESPETLRNWEIFAWLGRTRLAVHILRRPTSVPNSTDLRAQKKILLSHLNEGSRGAWEGRCSSPSTRDDVVSSGHRSTETAMKTLIMALVALSVVAGLAPVANALDSKSFYEQQDRQSGGSN
jgi:hypothetical protein